jgi:arsenite/tail-anchored protein-transporting ATPase
MVAGLLERLGRSVTFVVGKGGVGKTTTAGGLALALADRGQRTRLLSTDPAHSLSDLFRQPLDAGAAPSACTDRLVLEEVDAIAFARDRFGVLEPALREIIERGTYLDEDDAASLLGASIPGLDEVGAALRVGEAARSGDRLVVDTAPSGHTLRLLDAEAAVRAWIHVFEAMAAKAEAVASAVLHSPVRLQASAELDRLAEELGEFSRVIRRAEFVVVTGPGAVVRAETDRLVDGLRRRGLRVAATVAPARPGARADVLLPVRPGLAGCSALRAWWAEPPGAGKAAGAHSEPPAARSGSTRAGSPVPTMLDRDLVVFVGKGGVGKSTCAAALAVRLAADRPVTLMGADPAGSLADVLGGPVAGLTVVELDPEAELARFRDRFRDEVGTTFAAVGLDHAARMDREIMESLWAAAPPGIEELVAAGRLADRVGEGARLVLDTAPTGHFLRLVAMPELALDWVHRIMRILLKYRAVGGVDGPADALLRLAKRLRALRAHLSDVSRTSIVVVTVDEPLVQAESARLAGRLRELGLAVGGAIVNRSADRVPATTAGLSSLPTLVAPLAGEPVGAGALASFFGSWTPVA